MLSVVLETIFLEQIVVNRFYQFWIKKLKVGQITLSRICYTQIYKFIPQCSTALYSELKSLEFSKFKIKGGFESISIVYCSEVQCSGVHFISV